MVWPVSVDCGARLALGHAGMTDGLLEDAGVEVGPVGVLVFDEFEFPRAVPVFDSLFARDGVLHGGVKFVEDQKVDLVLAGEAFGDVVAVLPDALGEVAGDAGVEGAVSLAGEKVDGGLFHER